MKNSGERATPGQLGIHAFRRIYDLMAELYGAPDKSVLDYGCGTGYGSFMLSQAFGQVTAIDVEAETIRFCRANYVGDHLEFSVFDPAGQPFPNESFDHVFSFQVFEHVPLESTRSYVRNIWNMLKPGGVAIVTTPNAYNYHGGYSGNPFHVKEYTANELQSLFEEIVPAESIELWAVEDVPTTRLKNKLMRGMRNSVVARVLSKIILRFQVLEARGLIKADHRNMLKREKVAEVIGSYYVQVSKPAAAQQARAFQQ